LNDLPALSSPILFVCSVDKALGEAAKINVAAPVIDRFGRAVLIEGVKPREIDAAVTRFKARFNLAADTVRTQSGSAFCR
jgi:hypothetical protein